MKRKISMLLGVFVIICTLPLTAFATTAQESPVLAREKLIQSACEAFPEFQEKIMEQSGESTLAPYSAKVRHIVYSETRAISDNKKIQYCEYSDGVILLSSVVYESRSANITVNSRESSSFAVNYDVTIEATMPYISGYFKLSNVKFTLINTQYDCITSLGTPSKSGNCTKYQRVLPSSATTPIYETASGDAKILYDVWFQYGSGGAQTKWTQVTFCVGKDTFSCDFVDLDS